MILNRRMLKSINTRYLEITPGAQTDVMNGPVAWHQQNSLGPQNSFSITYHGPTVLKSDGHTGPGHPRHRPRCWTPRPPFAEPGTAGMGVSCRKKRPRRSSLEDEAWLVWSQAWRGSLGQGWRVR